MPRTTRRSNNDHFTGNVKISFNLEIATNELALHADDSLTIKDIKVSSLDDTNKSFVINNHNFGEYQTYAIYLNENLTIGNYILEIEYSGNFGSLTGF